MDEITYVNKFLDYEGLKRFWTGVKNYISNKEVTNITITYSPDAADVTLAKGTGETATTITASLHTATTSAAGLMSAADKTKLDGVENGAQVNKLEKIIVAAGNSNTGTVLATSDNKGAILRIETDLKDIAQDSDPLRPASAMAVKNYVTTSLANINTDLSNEIDKLKTTTDTHTAQIAELQTTNQSLDTKINNAVDALNDTINTVSAAVKTNADAIAEHIVTVNTALSDYYNKTETDDKISEKISKLSSTVTAITSTSGLQVFTEIKQTNGKLTSVNTTNLRIVKAAETTDGMASTYQLQADNVVLGDIINIPKDQFLKSGEVLIVETVNDPYQGAQVGDTYIKIEFQNQATPVYIPANSLVTIYEDSDYLSTTVTGGKPTISLDYNKLSKDILTAVQDNFVDTNELTEAINIAKSEIIGTATDDYNTLGGLEDKVKEAIKSIEYKFDATAGTLATTVTTIGGRETSIGMHEIIKIDEINALFEES